MSQSAARLRTIQTLRQQLVKDHRSHSCQQIVPTGLPSLDTILPDGGIPTASLIEWVGESGQFAASIALRSALPLLSQAGCLAVIDEPHEFCAAAAVAQGIPLQRLLLIRPRKPDVPITVGTSSGTAMDLAPRTRYLRRVTASHSEALWALEQTVRCSGVRVVVYWLDKTSSAVLRRLQLAVERSGVTVMLIRPTVVLGQPSFADLRLTVRSKSDPMTRERQFEIRVVRSRHGVQHEGTASLKQRAWQEQVCPC